MPTTLLGSANAATGGQSLPGISLISTEAAQAGRGGTGMVGVPAPIVGSKPITPIVNVADTVIPDFRTAQGTAAYQAYLQSDAAKAAGITPEYVAGVNSNVPSNVGSLSSQQIVTQTLQNIAKNPASTPVSVANATATLTNMGAAVPPSPIVPSAITPIVTPNVPTPTVSAVLGFNPTGNVVRDLVTLKNNGASAFLVASYLAMNGGWNWNVGTSPNSTPQEKELANYLTSLGLSQDSFGGAYYQLDNPTVPNAMIRIPASIFNKATPTEQLALAKLTGLIPKDAVTVSMNPDGSLSYSLSSKMTSDYALTKPVLDQINKDNPTLYKNLTSDLNTLGQSGTVLKYQDAINKAVGELNATQVAKVTAAQTTQQQTLDDWVNGLNPSLKSVYNNAFSTGGVQAGISAVNNSVKLDFEQNTLPSLPANLQTLYKSSDFSSFIQSKDFTNYIVSEQQKYTSYTLANTAISGYKSYEPSTSNKYDLQPTGYDFNKYLIDTRTSDFKLNPTSIKYVNDIFPDNKETAQSIINNAQSQLDSYKVINQEITTMLNSNLAGGRSSMSPETASLITSIEKSGLYKPELSGGINLQTGTQKLTQQEQAKAQWDALNDSQRMQVIDSYSQDVSRSSPFAETVKQLEDAKKESGVIGKVATIVLPFAGAGGMGITAIEAVMNVVAPSTITNKSISVQINNNANMLNTSSVLSSDNLKLLDSTLKNNGISVKDGQDSLKVYQSLSPSQKADISKDYTRMQLGLTRSTMEKILAGALVVATVIPVVGNVLSDSMKLGGISGVAAKIAQEGMLGTQLGITALFVGSSIPTILSKDTPTFDKLTALAFDALMLRGTGKMFFGEDIISYGAGKVVDLVTNKWNPESLRLKAGMPAMTIAPGVSGAKGIDIVKIGEDVSQNTKVDMIAADSNGIYTVRINPLQRASGLLDIGGNKYTFAGETSEFYDDTIANAKVSGEKIPSYIVDIPRSYAGQIGKGAYDSQWAWVDRAFDVWGQKGFPENDKPILRVEVLTDNYPKGGFGKYGTMTEDDKAFIKPWVDLIKAFDYEGAMRWRVEVENKGLMGGWRMPDERMLSQGGSPFVELEAITGAKTKMYIVGESATHSPKDVFNVLGVKPELENVKPTDWDNLTNRAKEDWYRNKGAISPDKAKEIETLKPENWDDMSPDAQSRWMYDNGVAVKVYAKGQLMPMLFTSQDPEAKPPSFITRAVTELVTEPYTRIKRALNVFDPNKTRMVAYGKENVLAGLDAIEGKANNEGQIHVRDYDNAYANVRIVDGKYNGTGIIVDGDYHGMRGYGQVIKDEVNMSLGKNIIKGSDGNLKVNINSGDSWSYTNSGDGSDRGLNSLKYWKDQISIKDQVAEQNAQKGADVKWNLTLGNHDLEHITGDHIKGVKATEDDVALSAFLKENVLNGKITAANLVGDGGIDVHAGLSYERYPEYRGKNPDFIVGDLNRRLLEAVSTNDFATDTNLFAIGKLDADAVDGKVGSGAGGIFWFRPGESAPQDTYLIDANGNHFKQYAGHTPTITRGGMDWAVQDRNGITYVDTARWFEAGLKDKAINFYADTPTYKSVHTGEILAKLGEGKSITFPLSDSTSRQVAGVTQLVESQFLKFPYEVTLKVGEQLVKFKLPSATLNSVATDALRKFTTEDISALDTKAIHTFDLLDAKDIPANSAKEIQDYILKEKGIVYGSFVTWLKMAGAVAPNDVDIVFANKAQAISDLLGILHKNGNTSAVGYDRGIRIPDANSSNGWTTIINIADPQTHAAMNMNTGFTPKTSVLSDGTMVETLGTQILNQAFGSLRTDYKSNIRGQRVAEAAPTIVSIAKMNNIDTTSAEGNIFTPINANKVGLTVKIPENITPDKLTKFVDEFNNVLNTTDGKLNYGLASGYPNINNADFIYLGLKDDASLATLVHLQGKINDISKSLGYNEGDFKVQAGITLGTLTGSRNSALGLFDVMKEQANNLFQSQRGSVGNISNISTDLKEYQKSNAEVFEIPTELRTQIENSRSFEDKINTAARSEENYPPQVPSSDYVSPEMGQLSLTKLLFRPTITDKNVANQIYKAGLQKEALESFARMPITDENILKIVNEIKLNDPAFYKEVVKNNEYVKKEVYVDIKSQQEKKYNEIANSDRIPNEKYVKDNITPEEKSREVASGYKPTIEKTVPEVVTTERISEKDYKYNQPSYYNPYYGTKYNPPPPPPPPPPPYNKRPIVELPPKHSGGKEDKRADDFKGALGWKQGFGYWFIKSPYSRKSDIAFFKTPPEGSEIVEGAKAAYRSIKLMTGKPPARELLIPLGIMTIKIKQPEYKAGKSGAISYKMNRVAKKGRKTGMVRIVT